MLTISENHRTTKFKFKLVKNVLKGHQSSLNPYLVAWLYRMTSAHQRVQCDVTIKRCTGHDGGTTGTPLNVKTPLIVGAQLVYNLKKIVTVK